MARKSYPLELILRAHGPCELLNHEEQTIWASDADDDFREEFNDEFLGEDDIGDILEYLEDKGVLTTKEAHNFANELWDFNVETVDDVEEDQDEEEEEE